MNVLSFQGLQILEIGVGNTLLGISSQCLEHHLLQFQWLDPKSAKLDH